MAGPEVTVHEEERLPLVEVNPEVRFGPKEVEYVPLGQIIVLKQVREFYPPDHIRALADSMEYVDSSGRLNFEMLHQATIARLDYEAAVLYMKEHGAHYAVDHSEGELGEPDANGKYHILISGHCRRLAVILNCERHGLNKETVPVAMSPRDSITFEEALGLQVRENFHMRPSAQEDAHSILRYYSLRTKREGSPPSFASCSRVLGYSASKIKDALRFAMLPVGVQEFAEIRQTGKEPPLSYTTAIQLSYLLEAYVSYHKARMGGDNADQEKVAEAATNSVISYAQSLVATKTKSARTNLSRIIEGKITELTGGAPYLEGDEGLFDLPDGLERRRHAVEDGGRKMGSMALWAIEYRLGHSEMTKDEEDRVLAAADAIRSRRAKAGRQLAIVDFNDAA